MEPLGNVKSKKAMRQKTRIITNLTAAAIVILIMSLFYGFMCFDGKENMSLELNTRIDINSAEAVSLMRLPQIGRARASAIVAFRLDRKYSEKAFNSIQDLQKVKGIGPKTAERLQEYIVFN